MAVISFNDAYQYALDAGASPEEARTLAAIAGAESTYDTQAHNPDVSTGDNSYGLWQINMLGQMGKDRAKNWGLSNYEQLWDPKVNARAALDILRSQGWKAWTTFTSGAYKKYLAGDVPGVGQVAAANKPAGGLGIGLAHKVASAGNILGSTAGVLSGKPPTDALGHLTSPVGDSLGERLQAIMGVINGGPNG